VRSAPGSGIDKGRRCTCWPRPDDARVRAPADLPLALPGVPRPRPAVLQPRRPACSTCSTAPVR
jgi:hypothetical protein